MTGESQPIPGYDVMGLLLLRLIFLGRDLLRSGSRHLF